MHMNTNMGTTIYWHKNQFIVRLKTQVRRSIIGTANPAEFVAGKVKDAFDKLNNQATPGKSLDVQPIDEQPLEFCPPISSIASTENVDVGLFYRINPSKMGSMQGDGGAAGMGDDDRTLAIIQQLDHGKVLQKALQNEEGLSTDFVHVIPHWLKACTPDTVQGCPISPPIPVEEPSASVRRKLQFQDLPDALKNATGKGVTVLVLDTLPKQKQIEDAAKLAGDSNLLLKAMRDGMRWDEPFNAVPPAINFRYQELPEVVEGTPPERVGTGKDIYGRHVGFNLADHGLFIAGIIRDLAPEANIECIRVLNNDGVGDIARLGSALKDIRNRMLSTNPDTGKEGDLHNKSVVINLSMVVLPPEDDMPIPDGNMATEILKNSHELLSSLIQCLTDRGAIFVAAAGNDSDPRMDVSEMRFGPRYPAALADHITKMIPVGAVNLNKQAAKYSNYPGPKGIATYGGDIPKPDPWLPSAMWHVPANVDRTDLDALCGVYSATECPALSKNDGQQTYAVPTSSAWAYWSGTSFATPIISALAARILQGQDPKGVDVREGVMAAAGKQTVSWTGIGDKREDISGSMIIAEQK